MIAIKDFKMPVDCSVCFGRGAIWCRFDESDRIVIPALPDESLEGRPEWCPLVDVPDMNVGKCSEIPNNSDSVSRRAAIEAIANQSRFSAEEIINICDKSVQDENGWLGGLKEAILAVLELPSAQPERKKGKWISVKGSNGKDYHKCSECLHTQDITGVKNYCSVCGAEMMGVQDE